MPTVTITTYNTLQLVADDVYILVTPYAGPYYYNVFNMGPLPVYIRQDADPVPLNVNCETLPPNCADNLILVPDGTAGLRLLAGPAGTDTTALVTVRLVRG